MKNRIWKAFLLMVCILLTTFCAGMQFETKAEPLYTYTVTISAGNQGSFPDAAGVGVDNTASGSGYQIQNDGKTIRISGLQYGDVVSCNAPAMTALSDNSKYYVKGIRQSGRDNNTVSASAFQVTKDMDYVVAYGIPGELTEYSVYYVDEDGAELAPSQTYFGNVGDEPVIAYLYIDGYVPATYTESQKLVSDATENVFIFVYMRATRDEAGTAAQDSSATEEPAGSQTPAPTPQVITTEIVVEETEVVTVTEEPTYVEEDGNNGSSADSGSDDADADTDGEDAKKGFFAAIGDAIGGVLSKIGDAVTPLANFVKEKVEEMAANGTLVPALVGLIALIVLIVLLILFLKRRRKDDEENSAEAAHAKPEEGAADSKEESTEAKPADPKEGTAEVKRETPEETAETKHTDTKE